MAWYAELKRRCWYCINGGNAIRWYKQKLYDDWFASLTNEQKLQLEENKKKRAEQRERETKEAINRLFGYATAVSGLYSRLYDEPYNDYGGVYDEAGFPKRRCR